MPCSSTCQSCPQLHCIIWWTAISTKLHANCLRVCELPACLLQTLVAYLFGKELKNSGSGLVAAALMAVVPGEVSGLCGTTGLINICMKQVPSGIDCNCCRQRQVLGTANQQHLWL
eukprot:GHRR01029753.1.p2 GENE.GHRR01029753.1~~GHRR01029753.1.p2  ORF type:complete len:116 (+),score=38.20 GHRR01029753.1:731-1078(+)